MKAWGKYAALAVFLLGFSAVEASTVRRRAATAGPPTETIFAIETPAPGATVFGIVEVKGFVLDPRGVSNIRLVIDGVVRNAVDMNQPREDLRRKYPGFFGDAGPAEPGFRGSFLASALSNGEHTLAIEVTFAGTTAPGGEPAKAILGARTIVVDNTRNQPPLGDLDNPGDPFTGGMQVYLSGIYPITGWALDDRGIRQTTGADGKVRADIEVLVDGQVVGQAMYPLPRPDIANAYPDVPGSGSSGFQLNLDTTRFANGMHRVAVRAWDTSGESRVLAEREVYFQNHEGTSRAFGAVDWPPAGGLFYAKLCSSRPSSQDEYDYVNHHLDWISGWVLDVNENNAFEGVVAVELLLNGVSVKRTDAPEGSSQGPREDLPMLNALGAKVKANIYGIERPDLLYLFPNLPYDAQRAGFFFVIDTNYERFGKGRLRPGLNYISVIAHRKNSTTPFTLLANRPVFVGCDHNANIPTIGNLDKPGWLEPVKGLYTVKGWAVDTNASTGNYGITRLNFYVDGILDGSLVIGDPTLAMDSPDVKALYPWLPAPYVEHARFEYVLDTSKYTDGIHTLVVEAVDGQSFKNQFIQRQVVFDNLN
ncbi:MAG: hypothetical protein ACOY7U_10855 [Acidobacteriota bacterium]|nr:MAG: hypothetical protein KatS3mg007_1004 [Thermoanaerobaculum sp.]